MARPFNQMQSSSKPSSFSLAGIIAVALLLLPGIIVIMMSLATRPYLGWSLAASDAGRVTVTHIEPNSSAARAALREGDVVVAVGDVRPDATLGRSAGQAFDLELINRHRAGDDLTFEITHDGARQALQANLSGVPTSLITTHLLLFLAFWVIAGVLLWARHDDALVRTLVITILAMTAGNFYRPATDFPLNTISGMLLQQICALGRFLGPALLVNFALVFPRRTLPSRTINRIRAVAFGITGLLFIVEEYVILRGALSPNAPYLLYSGVLETIRYFDIRFFVFLAAWGACGILLYRAARKLEGREKIQVKWITWSVLFAFVADTVIVVIALYGAGRFSDYLLSPYRNLLYLTVAASLLIAIMRYDLFDIDRVIRSSVLYSCTTALMFMLFTGCENVVSDVLATRMPVGSTRIGTLIAAVVAAALFTPVRKLLDRAVSGIFGPPRIKAGAQAKLYQEL